MIILLGEMRSAPGEGAKAAPLLAAHAEAVRAEAGCELYAFSFDAADPDHVRANAAAGAITLTALDLAALDAAFPPPRRKETLGML